MIWFKDESCVIICDEGMSTTVLGENRLRSSCKKTVIKFFKTVNKGGRYMLQRFFL